MSLIKNITSKLSRLLTYIVNILGSLVLLGLLVIFFTSIGYRSALQEVKIAEVKIIPDYDIPQEFTAKVNWLDGKEESFRIKGDQFYIDAKILKWNKWANMLGVKTWYELDRLGGRYQSINDELTKPRTIYSLAREKDFDIFQLRKKYPLLSYIVEANYGSALYVVANNSMNSMKFDLLISRTGLTLSQVEVNNDNYEIDIKIN